MTMPTTMMTLAQAHALLPGSRQVGEGATPILRVHSDTRTLQPGDLFVALRGPDAAANRRCLQALTPELERLTPATFSVRPLRSTNLPMASSPPNSSVAMRLVMTRLSGSSSASTLPGVAATWRKR